MREKIFVWRRRKFGCVIARIMGCLIFFFESMINSLTHIWIIVFVVIDTLNYTNKNKNKNVTWAQNKFRLLFILFVGISFVSILFYSTSSHATHLICDCFHKYLFFDRIFFIITKLREITHVVQITLTCALNKRHTNMKCLFSLCRK